VVSINPLPEAGLQRFRNPQRASGLLHSGTAIANLNLPIRVNGDHAFFTLVNRQLVEREERNGGVLDQKFIDEQCEGFDDARAGWLAADVESLHTICGLDAAQVEAFVDETVNADRVIVCWAMGLTQHRNSVSTIREIVNYVLLRGNVGRPGAGACPVRGHSNVQGDRTVGIYEKPSPAFLDSLGKAFDFNPPREHGFDVVESIRALRDGQARVMVAVGGNFAAATPDTEVTYAALRNADFTVQASTKLNRSHIVTGKEALILPCLGRTEIDEQATGPQFVTVEDSMCAVHASRGHLEPASPDLRSEAWIVSNLAHRVLGPDDSVDWIGLSGDYSRVRDAIEQVIPGFTDFNERIVDGFVLPNPPRDTRTFPTASGKAVFTSAAVEAVEVPPGHLMLQTMRSHDQYNTTIYGLDDRYRGIKGERRVVFVHPDDLTEFGIADGTIVDLVSISPDGERRAAGFRTVGYPTPRGCAAAYFPEANALVPLDSVATESGTPTSKSIVVRLVVSPV
jgi:molybdopterin-dependent oxidoreductase alpha subunit